MDPTLLAAIIFIVSAWVCYSIGVWGEKLTGRLRPWHLVFFWIGFAADTTGTTLMSSLSGAFKFNIHGISGVAAILLMLIHAVWASAVLVRRNRPAILSFHRFSVFVWVVWQIPFLTGVVLAMRA